VQGVTRDASPPQWKKHHRRVMTVLIRLSVQLILGDVLLATPHRNNEKDRCRVMTMLIPL
jgi:hypothetical protein